jgi:hypothetical protein
MKRTHIKTVACALVASSFGLATQGIAEESFVKTAVSTTTISGFVDTSAVIGFGDNTVHGRSFVTSENMDGFNFHMANVSLSSEPVGSGEFKAGYNVELLFGPAANKITSTSALTGANGGAGSDFAVKQAYVDLLVPVGENGLSLQIGTWDTIVGYEVFNSKDNPHFTRSFAFFIEPFVHTGVKGSYAINDSVEFLFGVADSYNSTIGGRSPNSNNGDLTYLAALSLTMPEDGALAGANLYVGAAHGPYAGTTIQDTLYYVGVSLPVSDMIALGASNDYLSKDTGGYANATSFYLSFFASEKLSFHNRIEYAVSNGTTWDSAGTGQDEELLGETFTIQYDMFENVLTRLEARYDHSLEGDIYGSAANDDSSLSLMANIVYMF